MCKGTTYGTKYSGLITREKIHPNIRHLYTRGVCCDICISEEIEYLLSNGVATWGHSCCGHGAERSLTFIKKESIGLAKELGYEVVEVQDSNWEEERTEWTCLLKTGTTDVEGLGDLIVLEKGGKSMKQTNTKVKMKHCSITSDSLHSSEGQLNLKLNFLSDEQAEKKIGTFLEELDDFLIEKGYGDGFADYKAE